MPNPEIPQLQKDNQEGSMTKRAKLAKAATGVIKTVAEYARPTTVKEGEGATRNRDKLAGAATGFINTVAEYARPSGSSEHEEGKTDRNKNTVAKERLFLEQSRNEIDEEFKREKEQFDKERN